MSSSLKVKSPIFDFPIKWIPEVFYWGNYVDVWTSIPFHLYYLNALKIAVVTTVLTIITSSLAGYTFEKIQFPERDKLFFLYLATMMIPY